MVPLKVPVSASSLYHFPDLELTVFMDSLERATPIAMAEVVHPTAQDRIDLLDHIPQGNRPTMVDEFSDPLLNSRFSLAAGRDPKPDPFLATIAKLSDFESQKVSRLLAEIDDSGFLPIQSQTHLGADLLKGVESPANSTT